VHICQRYASSAYKVKRNGPTKPDPPLSHSKANLGMEKQQGALLQPILKRMSKGKGVTEPGQPDILGVIPEGRKDAGNRKPKESTKR